MARLVSFISLIILFTACNSKEEKLKIPIDILTPEQMTAVIVDFHLVEASIVMAQQNHEDVNILTVQRYSSVLKKHKITRQKFDDSIRFYTQHIKEMQEIYQDVVVELSKTQSRIISK